MQSISVLGIGRAGGALSVALARAGFKIDYLIHRGVSVAETLPVSAERVSIDSIRGIPSDVVLIATGDPEIPSAARAIRSGLSPGAVVLHTSGSLSSDILGELAASGHSTGSFHPLVSISEPVSGAENFTGAYFCIEGDERAALVGRAIAEKLGGKPFSIAPELKPLYHAAAVTACGHLVALIDVAIQMLSRCGLDQTEAKAVLLPLIESTIRNLEGRSPGEALTGSFARADVDTIKRHIESIDAAMPELVREIYLTLGEYSTDLAAATGVDAKRITAVRESIRVAKRKS